MKPLTQAEDRAALVKLIRQERAVLAECRRFIQFQRDVLNAPPKRYEEAETQAMLSTQAIEWYEAELDQIEKKAPTNGLEIGAV